MVPKILLLLLIFLILILFHIFHVGKIFLLKIIYDILFPIFLAILISKNLSIYIVTLVISIPKLIGQLPFSSLTMKRIILKLPFSHQIENLTRLNFSLKNFRQSNILNSDVRTYTQVGIALPVKTRVKPLIISWFAVA